MFLEAVHFCRLHVIKHKKFLLILLIKQFFFHFMMSNKILKIKKVLTVDLYFALKKYDLKAVKSKIRNCPSMGSTFKLSTPLI